ncbi:hypothetical protein [Kandleria vitulina]|uniref:hypothetical protein n=1 Tax=Kandleria vitulina TaxID=1630 RepID=UPI00048BC62F|nr:hypothetical protein [Kandleria vitulina]
MNIHPLLRVDKKEYLEDLQMGNLFMRPNLYYQKMYSDEERGDIYDGAIYGDIFECNLSKEMKNIKISHPRIVLGNAFIKSFFQYSDEEVEKIGEDAYRYFLSEKSKNTLTQFNDTDSVMIILDTKEFIKQFEEACSKNGIQCGFGNVHYMTDEDIRKQEQLYKNLEKQSKILNPVFVKRKEYSNQQEYRLYVQHSISIEIDEKMKNQNGAFFKKSTVDKTFEFNIGQIDGYSMIISLKEFIDHSILIDYKHQVFSISE